MPRRATCALLLVLFLSAASCGCGGAARASEPLADWLSVDTRAKTVTLRLHAEYNGAYSGFNFNGYGKGQVLVDVPQRWRVNVSCVNDSSSRNHSCAIVTGPSGTIAFPGAATRPLPPHGSTSFSVHPSRPGSYRIACVVPGHEDAGMWDVLDVTGSGRPSVVLLRRPATR